MGVLNDYIITERKAREKRLEICNDCEQLSKVGICKECGCIVRMKTKLKMASCPLDKWLAEDGIWGKKDE